MSCHNRLFYDHSYVFVLLRSNFRLVVFCCFRNTLVSQFNGWESMKKHEVHSHLLHLDRAELESISQEVLGTSNAELANKTELIKALLPHHKKVINVLGLKFGWWAMYHTHVYSLCAIAIGITGLVLAILARNFNSAGPRVDEAKRQTVLRRIAREQSIPSQITTKSDVKKSWVDVEKVPAATNTGFELLENEITCDLRRYRAVSSVDIGKPVSPVIQRIRQVVKNVGDATKYRLNARTSGVDVYSWSRTHPEKLKVYASDQRLKIDKYPVKPRILEFDVDDDPRDREFVIEASKTYWNAFQNHDQSWTGVTVVLPTASMRFLLMFPDDKPFTEYERFVHDANGNRIDLPVDEFVVEDPRGRWIWWEISNPKPHHGYNIDWEW